MNSREGSPSYEKDHENWPAEDTLKILISSDNHLGYNEKDSIRCKDSFESFEEILQIAQEKEVDFVVLGGDLFHENKPSRNSLHQALTLLRQYCLGDRPCSFDFVSDQSINFPNAFSTVNYLDPNINVSIPVFSIHGNHDDPAGLGGFCALDLLSASGLVNYFGRSSGVEDVLIHPLLFQKGKTKFALYGLGNIRDEKLHKTFINNKVRAVRPNQKSEEWFNMMLVHQNRCSHSQTKKDYLPESYIFDFMDMVVWGHEHECLIDPQLNPSKGFYVVQPGSSVATSLCDGESVRKHVAILNVYGTSFHMEKVPLKTVRPFIFKDIILDQYPNQNIKSEERTLEILTNEVNKATKEALRSWLQINPEAHESDFPKPLIRLRVELGTNMEAINIMSYRNKFNDMVANPKDVIKFRKKKSIIDNIKSHRGLNQMIHNSMSQPIAASAIRVEDLLDEILNESKPSFLPNPHMSEVLKYSVEKEEKNAIIDYINKSKENTIAKVISTLKSDSKEEVVGKILHHTESQIHSYGISGGISSMDQCNVIQKITTVKRTRTRKTQDTGIGEYIKSTQKSKVSKKNDAASIAARLAKNNSVHIIDEEEILEPPPIPNPATRTTRVSLGERIYQPDSLSEMGESYIPPTEIDRRSVYNLDLLDNEVKSSSRHISINDFILPKIGTQADSGTYLPTEIISSDDNEE